MKRSLNHNDDENSTTVMMDTTTDSSPTPQQQQQQQQQQQSAVSLHMSASTVTASTSTAAAQPDHKQAMQQYIHDALEREEMSDLVQPVTDVLIASHWRMKWFYDPNKRQTFIDVLKEPSKDYRWFSNVLTMEQAKELSRSVISISAALLQPAAATSTHVSPQRDAIDCDVIEKIRTTTLVFQQFVNSLQDAEVSVHETMLRLVDGSLDPPPPPKHTEQHMIEIFRIDLSEYRKELHEKDDLHPGAFDTMHIVRLPLQVPGQDALGCDTLWITGDDLAVFEVTRSLRKVILLGNPGIGKSWWQWQYVLYSLRPDVYCWLSRKKFPAGYNGNHLPASEIIRYDAEAQLKIVIKLENSKMTVTVDPLTPYILDSEETVLLFEPGANPLITVPYQGLTLMSIVATVSPDLQRYKEFEKNGGIATYLPCPSKPELLAIAAFLRPLVPSEVASVFRVTQIIARIDEFGPFPRYVFAYSKSMIKSRDSAVAALDTKALEQLASVNSIEKTSAASSAPVSHWFLCYQVDRTHEERYRYGSMHLEVSSQSTLDLVRQKRDSVRLEFKLGALRKLHQSGKMDNYLLEREWLEDAFAELAATDDGLTWRVNAGSCVQTEPGTIRIKFEKIVASQSVTLNKMDENVLYYRIDPQFPFFDGVWMQGGRLFGFQATTSKSHPKRVETFKNALTRLNIAIKDLAKMQMTIYYVMMPLCFDHLIGKKIPLSFYWKNLDKSKTEIESLSKHITFALLRPPNDFSAGRADL